MKLRKKIDCAGPLDLTGDGAVHLGGDASDLAGKDTAGLGRELGQDLRVLIADFLKWKIETLGGHRLIVLTEVNPALNGLGLRHNKNK